LYTDQHGDRPASTRSLDDHCNIIHDRHTFIANKFIIYSTPINYDIKPYNNSLACSPTNSDFNRNPHCYRNLISVRLKQSHMQVRLPQLSSNPRRWLLPNRPPMRLGELSRINNINVSNRRTTRPTNHRSHHYDHHNDILIDTKPNTNHLRLPHGLLRLQRLLPRRVLPNRPELRHDILSCRGKHHTSQHGQSDHCSADGERYHSAR
jgi:hypothetical protein